MNYGKVKWFDAVKGYGFIITANLDEYFFHYKSILQSGYKKLDAGDYVSFNIIVTAEGKKVAVNVSKENKTI